MNKGRLEAFSDGVFSIVITLLVFDIKVPMIPIPVSNADLWYHIGLLTPIFAVYFVTFAVIAVLWINHHFIFHSFAVAVDRRLNLMNLVYLMFVVFIPFSARLLGEYPLHQPAAIVYGVNLFIVVLLTNAMVKYITKRPELYNRHLTRRIFNQASFRATLSLACYTLGILFTFLSGPVSISFYAFPVVFNFIPGSLDLAEKIFRFKLDQ